MRRHILILFVLLSLPLWFGACGQAGEQTIDDASLDVELEERPIPGDMVSVPAGEFTMGSDKMPGSPPIAAPAHTVSLPDFEIDVYEVTNGQFARFQLESDYEAEGDWRSSYTIGREDNPVANLTWGDAKEFCAWAGKRLPTEVEWEKAARGTEGLRFPWGDTFDWTKANTNEHGVRDVIEVGSLVSDKSPYGCYDMMGNVTEWTSDILEPYPDGKTEGIPFYNGRYVAVRGGSYALKGESMTLWTRAGYMAGSQFGIGFRCARGGAEEAEAEGEGE